MDDLPDCVVSMIILYSLPQYIPLDRRWRALSLKSYSCKLATLYQKSSKYIHKWVCDINSFMFIGINAWTTKDISLHSHLLLNILLFRGEYGHVFQLIETYHLENYETLKYIQVPTDLDQVPTDLDMVPIDHYDTLHLNVDYMANYGYYSSVQHYNYIGQSVLVYVDSISYDCPSAWPPITTKISSHFLINLSQICACQGHFTTLVWSLDRFETHNLVLSKQNIFLILKNAIIGGHYECVCHILERFHIL